jgi:hypothetical protein
MALVVAASWMGWRSLDADVRRRLVALGARFGRLGRTQ